MDLAHGPLFAFLAIVGCSSFRRLDRLRFPAIWSWGLLIFVAIATEGLQHFVGRQPSAWDILANALGTTAGTLWFAARSNGPSKWLMRIGTGILLLAAMAAPLLVLTDAAFQSFAMPILASFESPLELMRWNRQDCVIQRVQEHATEGQWALRVDFNIATYPGIVLPEVPADWTPYEAFLFDVTLETPGTLTLIVKITDEAHNWDSDDRFQYQAQLHQGLNRIRIPMREIERVPNGRLLDLKHMRMLQMFTVKPKTPVRLYLDHLRLFSPHTREGAGE